MIHYLTPTRPATPQAVHSAEDRGIQGLTSGSEEPGRLLLQRGEVCRQLALRSLRHHARRGGSKTGEFPERPGGEASVELSARHTGDDGGGSAESLDAIGACTRTLKQQRDSPQRLDRRASVNKGGEAQHWVTLPTQTRADRVDPD